MSPVFAMFVGSWLCGVFASPSQGNQSLTREVILARLERLQNLIVDYEITTKYTPPFPPEFIVRKEPNGSLRTMHTGTRITHKQFSVLRDHLMYRADDESWNREFDHPDLAKVSVLESSLHVRTPNRTERFQRDSRGSETYRGEISNYAPLPGSGELDVALGLRGASRV